MHKKYLAALAAFALVTALLCCMFALPGHAAPGNALTIVMETDETALPRDTAFSVDVNLLPTGAGVSALRLYVLYDNTCFDWLPGETVRAGLVNTGMFAQAIGSGDAKYPAAMTAQDRANYSVIVLQWAAAPAGGTLPAIAAGTTTLALTLGFRVKADAPYAQPGGRIFLSTNYSYADTPYFYAQERAIDTAGAQLTIQPMPPAPELQTNLTVSNGYIYGFPAELALFGGAAHWDDADIGSYVAATNGGVFRLAHGASSSVTGTGTVLQLWNANETRMFGEYTMIVFGDADGNFVIDYDDWAAVQAMPTGPAGDGPFRFAADVNNDGTVDSADLQLIYEAAAGLRTIPQTR